MTAIQSLTPTVNGAQRNYAISLTDQFFGPVGARQRTLVSTPNQGRNLAFWGQEFWLTNENDGSASVPGYSDSGFGVAAGADYGSLSTGRYGVGFEHFNGDSISGDPKVTKTVNNWTVFSLYANWADSDTGLFFGTQASSGFGSFDEKRRIIVGEFTDTAKGHWQGWLAAWGATIGDVIGDDMFAIIPQASVDALYMAEDATRRVVPVRPTSASRNAQARRFVGSSASRVGRNLNCGAGMSALKCISATAMNSRVNQPTPTRISSRRKTCASRFPARPSRCRNSSAAGRCISSTTTGLSAATTTAPWARTRGRRPAASRSPDISSRARLFAVQGRKSCARSRIFLGPWVSKDRPKFSTICCDDHVCASATKNAVTQQGDKQLGSRGQTIFARHAL